jgi:hypothetical protein
VLAGGREDEILKEGRKCLFHPLKGSSRLTTHFYSTINDTYHSIKLTEILVFKNYSLKNKSQVWWYILIISSTWEVK